MGSNGGPYKAGKVYCGHCGEFRRPEATDKNKRAIPRDNGTLLCGFCGLLIRKQGRHKIKYKEPTRY